MSKSAVLPPPTLSGPSLLDIGAPAEAVKADFARRLQHALNAKGWNQSDLARAADIGRDSVSVYLRAKSPAGTQASDEHFPGFLASNRMTCCRAPAMPLRRGLASRRWKSCKPPRLDGSG